MLGFAQRCFALCGETYNLLAVTMKKMGVDVTFVDPDCTKEELNAAFKENTKAVFGGNCQRKEDKEN